MTLFQSIILAIVQGLAEFLPISSKGHLNLVQSLLGLTPSLTLDIILNTATLFSVFFFFRKQLSYFFSNFWYIVVGTIPAVITTLLFRHRIEAIFATPALLPYLFLITATLLFSTRFLKLKKEKISYKKALLIGIFQALAILPGISRSGSTIVAGLLMGLSPETAFYFSFCLLIPASIGALVFDAQNLNFGTILNPNIFIAFLISFFIGLLALKLLHQTLVKKKIWYFSIYVFCLSILLFFLF
jgi:undecaprenyl-diphosphatase